MESSKKFWLFCSGTGALILATLVRSAAVFAARLVANREKLYAGLRPKHVAIFAQAILVPVGPPPSNAEGPCLDDADAIPAATGAQLPSPGWLPPKASAVQTTISSIVRISDMGAQARREKPKTGILKRPPETVWYAVRGFRRDLQTCLATGTLTRCTSNPEQRAAGMGSSNNSRW